MKGRKHRATGGVNEAAEDLGHSPERRNIAPKIFGEAEKRKRGGKACGDVKGLGAKMHAGRKPRKSGGRATSDANPFTSARHGTAPKGHKVDMEME
jgi:hypothetical protein